jgi:adenosylhomocysteine nucleosidase
MKLNAMYTRILSAFLFFVTGLAIAQPNARRDLTGIVGAFDEEIRFLLTHVEKKKEHVIQHLHFTEGVLHGRPVVVAQTGIGKVNAAITTTLLLEHFQPRELIFTGIAGGLNPQLSPGDIIIGTKIAHHDYGRLTPDSMLRWPTRNPVTMTENPVFFPCDTGLVRQAVETARRTSFEKVSDASGLRSPKVLTGIIVTGDVFVSSSHTAAALIRSMHADATEMEGAAVAQVCWQQQVPFLIIRSMSDNANNAAHDDIERFYQLAARNSANLVIGIASRLINANVKK